MSGEGNKADSLFDITNYLIDYIEAVLLERVDMTDSKKDSGIQEIHIPREILQENPFSILTNPPRFPLLKGQEKFWIVRQITLLTIQGQIQWKQDMRHRHVDTYASYLGLIIYVVRNNACAWENPGGITFNVYDEYKKEQKFLSTIYFDGVEQSDIDEFIAAVRESLRKKHVHEDRSLNLIWNILNLR